MLITGTPFPAQSNSLTIFKAPKYIRGHISIRFVSWCFFLVVVFFRLLFLKGNPHILATTNPPFLSHLLFIVRFIRRFSYSILVWDIYPNHLEKLSLISENSIIYRVWAKLNHLSYCNASSLITLSQSMSRSILSSCRNQYFPAIPPTIIPNSVDTNFIQPLDKKSNPFALSLGLQDCFVIMYSGNIGATHCLEDVILSAKELRLQTSIKFLFIGDGLGKKRLQDLTSYYDLDNVLFIPMQSYENINLSLPLADVSIVSQSLGTESLSLPSKLTSYMSAGSAIIGLCSKNCDLSSFI